MVSKSMTPLHHIRIKGRSYVTQSTSMIRYGRDSSEDYDESCFDTSNEDLRARRPTEYLVSMEGHDKENSKDQ